MRIATICTLAFAITGERTKAAEKEEEKTLSTMPSKTPTKGSSTSRLLAKGLVLAAAVHSASGFGQPAPGSSVHPASGFGRPGGFHDGVFKPVKAKLEAKRDAGDFESMLMDGMLNVIAAQTGIKRTNLVPRDKQDLEKLWLDVMAENAKRDAEVSEDDVQVFLESQQSRALEPLKGLGLDTIHDMFFKPFKAEFEAAENADDFNRFYRGLLIEDILNDNAAKKGGDQRVLNRDLLDYDNQDLEKLWLGVMLKRDALKSSGVSKVSEDDVRVFQKFAESRLRNTADSDPGPFFP